MDFEQFYKEYYGKAYHYIYKRISHQQEAEDLTDTVFCKCYEKFAGYDPTKASPSTWLFVVINNTLKNYYRDKKPTVSADSEEMPEIADETSAGFIEAAELGEMRKYLAQALGELDEEKKRIVVLRYFKGLSNARIAEIMGLTEGNVRVILTRTLKKMKKYFDDNNIKVEF